MDKITRYLLVYHINYSYLYQMKTNRKVILETIKQVIAESAKVKFAGHQFMLKVDVNEDPNKKGLKIQFIPTTFGQISQTEQNDIAIELETRLEAGLEEYGMRVERDRNLKDKTVIGFFVYIEYFDKIVRQALAGQNPSTVEAEKEIDNIEDTDNVKI